MKLKVILRCLRALLTPCKVARVETQIIISLKGRQVISTRCMSV